MVPAGGWLALCGNEDSPPWHSAHCSSPSHDGMKERVISSPGNTYGQFVECEFRIADAIH